MQRRRWLGLSLLGVSVGFFQSCGSIQWGASSLQEAEAAETIPVESGGARLELSRVAGPLENPWSLAFLPDGRMLVTERPGRLRYVEDGSLSEPIAGVPEGAA